jgi:hypothetical protein
MARFAGLAMVHAPPATTVSSSGEGPEHGSGSWTTLAAAHDAAVQLIYTSIVRVHQHAACIGNRGQSKEADLRQPTAALIPISGESVFANRSEKFRARIFLYMRIVSAKSQARSCSPPPKSKMGLKPDNTGPFSHSCL